MVAEQQIIRWLMGSFLNDRVFGSVWQFLGSGCQKMLVVCLFPEQFWIEALDNNKFSTPLGWIIFFLCTLIRWNWSVWSCCHFFFFFPTALRQIPGSFFLKSTVSNFSCQKSLNQNTESRRWSLMMLFSSVGSWEMLSSLLSLYIVTFADFLPNSLTYRLVFLVLWNKITGFSRFERWWKHLGWFKHTSQ